MNNKSTANRVDDYRVAVRRATGQAVPDPDVDFLGERPLPEQEANIVAVPELDRRVSSDASPRNEDTRFIVWHTVEVIKRLGLDPQITPQSVNDFASPCRKFLFARVNTE